MPQSYLIDAPTISKYYKEIKRPFVGFPRSFLQITGDLNSALLLGQLCYWSEKMRKSEFYKEQATFEHEIGLSIRQVRRAIEILRSRGLIQTRVKKVNGSTVTFYTVDWPHIRALIFEIEECDTSVGEFKRSLPRKELLIQEELKRQFQIGHLGNSPGEVTKW